MGLFSNDKKLCPVCGKATPRLFPTKVEGQALCSACADKISMDENQLKTLRITDLQTHFAAREQNKALWDSFSGRILDIDGATLCIDDAQKLFTFYEFSDENPPVFRFDELVGYTILREDKMVESWQAGQSPIAHDLSKNALLGAGLGLLGALTDVQTKDRSDTYTLMVQLSNPYWKERKLYSSFVSGDELGEYELRLQEAMQAIYYATNAISSITPCTIA